MKMITSFLVFISVLTHISCSKEDEDQQLLYPLNYSYDHLYVEGTKMYVKTSSSFQELPLGGSFVSYDAKVLSELHETYMDLPVNEVSLVSSDSAVVTNTLAGSPFNGFNQRVKYLTIGDKLTFQLTDGANVSDFPMFKSANSSTIDFVMTAVQYTSRNSSNILTYSPIDASPAATLDINSALNQVETSENFQVGDTIVIGFLKMAFQ